MGHTDRHQQQSQRLHPQSDIRTRRRARLRTRSSSPGRTLRGWPSEKCRDDPESGVLEPHRRISARQLTQLCCSSGHLEHIRSIPPWHLPLQQHAPRVSGGDDRCAGGAGRPIELGESHFRIPGHLTLPSLTAQLTYQFMNLAKTRGSNRLAVGDQATVGVDR